LFPDASPQDIIEFKTFLAVQVKLSGGVTLKFLSSDQRFFLVTNPSISRQVDLIYTALKPEIFRPMDYISAQEGSKLDKNKVRDF